MAKSKDNNATFGMSGKVNQFVYRHRFGETLVSKPPIRTAVASAAQLNIQSIFKEAVLYARTAIADAALLLDYKKKAKRGLSAYNLALADYFKAPEIVSVDISQYSAAAGGSPNLRIAAKVKDNFRVESVKIKIEDAGGSMLEEGNAIIQPDGLSWVFTSTVAGATTSGNKVSITATDLPGNSIVEQIIV
jgi:hypothetical protein